jgi:nucleoside-diphosphate-sugar epimerase
VRVLVTGGCGYTGTVLVPKLLAAGYSVINLDAQWFGNSLAENANLQNIKGDIRSSAIPEVEAVIHLANVANDPAGDLDPKLTWEVNALASAQLADMAVRAGVRQFIYASSGSVYGVSDAPEVTEDLPLVPLTEYNKTKMVAERVFLSYADKMAVQIIRPGTCCGVSPRQRLDITVNGMTAGACNRGEIHVVGGSQNRPNIHIEDLTDLYVWMLARPSLTGIWNAGFENLTGTEIANILRGHFPFLPRVESQSKDRRSYRMNSDKLLNAGFEPKRTVDQAIQELINAHNEGKLKETDDCYNLRVMPRA